MRERDTFRRTERILYDYRPNLSRLAVLAGELSDLQGRGDIHAQDYSGRLKSGAGDADPVSLYVQKLLTLEHRISVLERYTKPVTRLLTDLRASTDTLSRHYLTILEDFYFGGLPLTRLLELTRWSRSAFYSRRLSLVNLAAEYLEF